MLKICTHFVSHTYIYTKEKRKKIYFYTLRVYAFDGTCPVHSGKYYVDAI